MSHVSTISLVVRPQHSEELVKNCPKCIEERTNRKEPFNFENLPTRPMEQIGIDLFKLDKWYLIIVDYYSRYFEIVSLTSMNENSIIEKMKEFFHVLVFELYVEVITVHNSNQNLNNSHLIIILNM